MIAAPNECGFIEVPVLGVANEPSAEWKLLIGDMDRVLGAAKGRLASLGFTFDQALRIYNDIPLHVTAAGMEEAELDNIIKRHVTPS